MWIKQFLLLADILIKSSVVKNAILNFYLIIIQRFSDVNSPRVNLDRPLKTGSNKLRKKMYVFFPVILE